jgi:hypothetical protein
LLLICLPEPTVQEEAPNLTIYEIFHIFLLSESFCSAKKKTITKKVQSPCQKEGKAIPLKS